ncbi:MAG: nitroreductase family protein [Treponema sp.]|nr:nitroreductase family protein [Treponema sp.]
MPRDIMDIIRTRRSTRSFEDRPVPRKDLDLLLEAAVWAPSGSNSQSWLFTAVTRQDILRELNEKMRQGFLAWTPDDDYPAKHGAKAGARREDFNFYNHAPVLIIASNRPRYENAMADCSLALENIFLAAENLGLGSCYINSPHWLRNDKGVRDFLFELGIPREHTICSSAAIGYIKKPSAPPPRKEHTVRVIE